MNVNQHGQFLVRSSIKAGRQTPDARCRTQTSELYNLASTCRDGQDPNACVNAAKKAMEAQYSCWDATM